MSIPSVVLSVGLTSWLIELPSGSEAAALHRYLRAAHLPGVVDVIAGARTVLLDGDVPRSTVDDALAGWDPAAALPPTDDRVLEVPVRYSGDDLAEVSALVGREPEEVIRAHTGVAMVVAFCGFAPGFAYLTGAPDWLRVPRLERPRTAVPAGAVAIAEEYTGVYPRRSPGGWRILGYTDLRLWDPAQDPPALLTPGTRVRFRAVEAGG